MRMRWSPFPEKSLSTPPPIGWLTRHKPTCFLPNTSTSSTLPASPPTTSALRLKVGIPIILLRNVSPALGLANGTRLVFMQLSRSVIQAKILTGSHVGNVVSIPRINMNTDADDKTIPVQIRRRQFPVRPAFAMTIDKSQGQTFQNIAIYLPAPVFAHGQLYIALSRVGDPRKITILITHLPLPDQPPGLPMTCNVVNTEIFRRVNPPPPLNNNNHTTTSSSSSSKCLRSKRLHYLGSVSLSQYSLVGVFSCTNCMFFTGKNKTQTRSQNRQDNKHEFIFANTFWQSPTHHFPLLLSLASIPTPSQSHTNRPLWVRA